MTHRSWSKRLLSAVVGLGMLVSACGGDDDSVAGPAVELDGTPRIADVEGRLVEVADDFSTLTLEGDRTYDIDDDLLAFAATDASVQPVLRLVDQYVQVGLDGDTAIWIGGISAVVDLPDTDPVSYFTDVLTEVEGPVATFRSGTVLTLSDGVEAPSELPAAVVATIDVGAGEVTALEPA